MPVMSRSPAARTVAAMRFRAFALLRALRTHRQAGSQMSKVCVPGGQVPLRTLVRAFDLRIFTIINGLARVEPPHGRAQPELNPHARPLGSATQNASSVKGSQRCEPLRQANHS